MVEWGNSTDKQKGNGMDYIRQQVIINQEDVFKEMLSRKEELEGQAVCRLHGKQIKIFYRVLRMFSV